MVFLMSAPCFGFYEWQKPTHQGDITGTVRLFGTLLQNPDNDFFYENRNESGLAGIARVMSQIQIKERWYVGINAYQTYIPSALVGSQSGVGTPLGVERSAGLESNLLDKDYAHFALDRLNVNWSNERMDIIAGRQPVNLATTFYFTPNDFFAPFAAQAFFRVYKPGVDALRAEIRLENLSQLSLIQVLGYDKQADSDTGWSHRPNAQRNSYLARISTVFHDTEWMLLAGRVRETYIIGGSLQGEWFNWLGVRAEGHYANPKDQSKKNYTEITLGMEHRWENSLEVRLELFHHGNGASRVSGYGLTQATREGIYLARRYVAAGASYEISPLLIGNLVTIMNLVDDSSLISMNAVYSLADETEMAFNLTLPFGEKPEGMELKSEYGLSPYSINLEWRTYR